MNPLPAVSGTALGGHLSLCCSLRPDGVSYISRQDFRVPVHIGKGHPDQGALVLNIANPTAGFFDGDRIDTDICVDAGAKLVLSTPAASRVYRTRSGIAATNFQKFSVGEGAFLEWIPEAFIPHAGASYRQSTQIDLEESSTLLFFEWLAPGRVASGEIFAYRKLRWEFDLRIGGRLTARERFSLQPEDESLAALKEAFPAAHYLSVYAAGCMTKNWPGHELDALANDDARLGHGPLGCGVNVIRALCRDSLAARRLLANLRNLLYSAADIRPPSLGRSIN